MPHTFKAWDKQFWFHSASRGPTFNTSKATLSRAGPSRSQKCPMTNLQLTCLRMTFQVARVQQLLQAPSLSRSPCLKKVYIWSSAAIAEPKPITSRVMAVVAVQLFEVGPRCQWSFASTFRPPPRCAKLQLSAWHPQPEMWHKLLSSLNNSNIQYFSCIFSKKDPCHATCSHLFSSGYFSVSAQVHCFLWALRPWLGHLCKLSHHSSPGARFAHVWAKL